MTLSDFSIPKREYRKKGKGVDVFFFGAFVVLLFAASFFVHVVFEPKVHAAEIQVTREDCARIKKEHPILLISQENITRLCQEI